MTTVGSVVIDSVSQNAASLTVNWLNGETSVFHNLWLRDCCYCDICGDCDSSLRRYVPTMETVGVKPSSISWTAEELRIEWEGDGHISIFSADWLSENRYDDRARAARRHIANHWDASTDLEALTFDYVEALENRAVRLALHKHLITHGVVIVRDGPNEPGGVTSFAGLFGEVSQSAYGAVFDLAPGNAVGTAGTTLREVPPHSDEAFAYAPPGIEVLACVRPAKDGGDSIMVDGFGIAEKLRSDNPLGFDLLARWNHHFVRFHPEKLDQRAYAPVIALDDDDKISGIRLHTRASAPLDLPEHAMEDYLNAYHQLCDMMMDQSNQIRLRLEAGDAVIFDNHRALHARSAFSDRQRFMQICGVTREKFHEQYRLLATQLGDTKAANMVLRAGVCR